MSLAKQTIFSEKMAFYWIIGFKVIFDTIILPVYFLSLYLTNSFEKIWLSRDWNKTDGNDTLFSNSLLFLKISIL